MVSIEDNTLIYHLTALDNFESILENDGLLPRNYIDFNIEDIADQDIIRERRRINNIDLLDYVPFHFFVHNPFDGAVFKNNTSISFIYITIKRVLAREKGFQIIPEHPCSSYMEKFPQIIYDYNEGFNLIDWDTMENRNYLDKYNKNVCMAECLYKGKVPINFFNSIAVKTKEDKSIILKLLLNENYKIENNKFSKGNISFFVDICDNWF